MQTGTWVCLWIMTSEKFTKGNQCYLVSNGWSQCAISFRLFRSFVFLSLVVILIVSNFQFFPFFFPSCLSYLIQTLIWYQASEFQFQTFSSTQWVSRRACVRQQDLIMEHMFTMSTLLPCGTCSTDGYLTDIVHIILSWPHNNDFIIQFPAAVDWLESGRQVSLF